MMLPQDKIFFFLSDKNDFIGNYVACSLVMAGNI